MQYTYIDQYIQNKNGWYIASFMYKDTTGEYSGHKLHDTKRAAQKFINSVNKLIK